MDSLTSNTIILSHHGLARTTTLHVYTIMGLYHHGGFSLKNFFSSRWSLPVRCVWRSYVYMCVCVCMCWLCVLYSFQKATPPVYLRVKSVMWWYVSNGDFEQRDGSLWLLLLQCKADLIISIVMSVLQHACECYGCCCTFVQPQLCLHWMVVDELLHSHTGPPSIMVICGALLYAWNEFTNYLNATICPPLPSPYSKIHST